MPSSSEQVGELLRQLRSGDVIDAPVGLMVRSDDRVLTSAERDLNALLRTRQVGATVVSV